MEGNTGQGRAGYSRRGLLRGIAAGGLGLGIAGCSGGPGTRAPRIQYPGDATRSGPPKLRPHSGVSNPVLTREAVNDRSFVSYVADPFVAPEGDTYHMFFEVFYDADVSADIAHATSTDGLTWAYDRVVLNDPYHLAYPYVFKLNGDWYMTPDKATYAYNGVPEFRIYRGAPFPTDWELVDRAVINQHFGDPTVVRHDGVWYVWSVEQERTTEVSGTRLHYTTDDALLDASWTEHPASPVATAERNRRPAGRPVVTDGTIYLFLQDVERTYGDKVRCFEVTDLATDRYAHREIAASPVIQSTGNGGWNDDGMHHVDAALAYMGERNVVAVDGKDPGGLWSIGLYELVS